ncbi:MAG: hypothetical protein ACLRT5_01285 [Lachnospiraceae bacterium]
MAEKEIRSETRPDILQNLFAVYLLASVCLAGYLEAMHLIHLDYEEVLDTGYLKIYETSFPDASWYYCAPVSFFAREPLTQVTSQVDGRYEDDGATQRGRCPGRGGFPFSGDHTYS